MVGTVLGDRYELLEVIGSGGMAVVYKAKCRLLNRFVAVKVLRTEFAKDEEFLSRFKIESQAAASLSHQNIVSIYDVGAAEGVNYIVMEYVEGITLKEYITQNGILPWREAIGFSIQILSALEHAHKNGIVHRDIKPHNIIITPEKVLKVTDFGIARASTSATLTISGTTIGSVHYFSPEQARGGYTDAKSDIYSLGIVMYEMLTGRVPFDGDSPITIAIMQIQNMPPSPKEFNISIPLALESIVMKAIKKDKDSRYQTATAMIADLLQVEKQPQMQVAQELEDGSTKKMPAVILPVEQAEEDVLSEDEASILDEPPVPYVPRSRRVQKKTAPSFESPQEVAERKSKKKAVAFGVATAVIIVAILAYSLWMLLFQGQAGADIEIPSLVGQKVTEAVQKYKDSDFEIVIAQRINDAVVEKDVIISQDPSAGMQMKKGKIKIEVVVSDGAKSITLENYKGKEEREVTMLIEQQGLKVTIVKKNDNNMAVGYVIETSPVAGTVVKTGSEITVFISEGGGGMVTVPTFVGLSLDEAKREIQQNELTLGSVGYQDSSKPSDTVLIQSISKDNEVDKFTQIDLLVSNGKGETNIQTATPTPSTLKTRSINVSIPQDRPTTLVKVVANGTTVYQGTHKKSELAIDVTIKGIGTVVVDLYYDGVKAKTITYQL